jgi:hypothetical protein
LLADIHGGECESHSSLHTLVGKAFQRGFYWHTFRMQLSWSEDVRRASFTPNRFTHRLKHCK